ncbi:uncharacterized protein METZ01_LOCUS309429 [marine metagenome]|uniref:Uncharacterized protein n=1 Tax=marine metagenome TaxID=408172 RepID=A0A382N8A4_9ZZZZ
MSAFQAEDGGFKSPRGGHRFSQKTAEFWPSLPMAGGKNRGC